MGKVYDKNYEIHFYEVDNKLQCTIESLLKFIEDIGTEQSEKLGCGMKYLIERNMAWVFYQYEIVVHRYPKYAENIKISTEPYDINKFYAFRKYDMYDENGVKIVEAKATFLLIDITKRRLTRVPEEQYRIYGVDSQRKTQATIDKIKELKESNHIEEINIKYSDIDINNHVNNIRYVQWAIDYLPIEFLTKHRLRNLKVSFEKESKYGEKLFVSGNIEEAEELVSTNNVIKNNEGIIKAKLIGIWDKK